MRPLNLLSETFPSPSSVFVFFRRAAADAAAFACFAARAGGSSLTSWYSVRILDAILTLSAASLLAAAVGWKEKVDFGSRRPEGCAKSDAKSSRVRLAEVRTRFCEEVLVVVEMCWWNCVLGGQDLRALGLLR